MKRIALLAVLVTALIPGTALARDRNHDGISDRWEAKHHLSTKHNVAHRDPDRDHASNLAEFRHHTNPRDADTDNDGVRDGSEFAEHTNARDDDSDNDGTDDGDEIAGHVASFDGTTLTITLNDNSTVSGAVTDATEIKCEGADDAHAATLRSEGGEDESGDDSSGSGDGEDRSGDDDHSGDNSGPSVNSGPGNATEDEQGDDDQGEDDDGDDDGAAPQPTCTKADLVEGAVVHEADLKVTSAGKVFEEVELVK